ncbi:MAG: S9 family peptidase [Bacteroides sp.]|nr:S9 family peptidase [Bacteroides sp.]
MKALSKTGALLLLITLQNLFTTNVMAQELKNPTLEDLTPGGETYRYAENLYGLQWWGDVCVKPTVDTLYTIDLKTGKESAVAIRATVNEILEKSQAGKLSHFYNVSFPWKEKPLMLIALPGKYITYDFNENRITGTVDLKKGAANKDYCTANGNVAYTVDNNLFVDEQAVTNEPEGIVCGQSVHRNEFGIHKGTFWSPTGQQLAFYRMDESMVTQYPLVDITARIGEVNNIRYPMAGMTSHKVTVGIYTPANNQTVYLQAGDPTDLYFTNISWAPDGKSLFLIELNRDQNHARLCRYDAATGELMAVLLEEKHPKYVEPSHPITFLPWDSTKFIYQSQRDGFNHLYLYNTKGELLKQLTNGEWLVQEMLGFDTSKKELIIASTEQSPLQSNLYRVNLKNGKRTPIGNAEGVHRAQLSASGRYLIDSYSSPTTPRNIELVDTEKGKTHRLLTAANPFTGFRMPTIETGTIKAADGVTDLYYRIIKPADFDPAKKYPAIVYVYGGPHAQMVNNGWMNAARGWDLYMANKGYILFSVDNRGSENRGLDFENATFRRLGIEEGKDQVKGAEYLQSLPYVDANRIGVHGWSFGGHMTTALLLRYPEVFKVGVAGGPVIDWSYYEVMYGERYMDTPQSNPEGYKECDLKNLAGNLKGHLLLIHDDHDDTCVPQHTLSFIKACVDARTYPDLFIYPGHKHNVIGRDRVHLHEKITRYFEDHL